MLSYGPKTRPRIFSAFLLPIIFIVCFSFAFLFMTDILDANPGTQQLSADSAESFSPVQVDANLLTEAKYDRLSDTVHGNLKSIRGLRQYIFNTVFFLRQALFFACLSIYVFLYFNKKFVQPLPIIAISIGGHAPPFARI